MTRNDTRVVRIGDRVIGGGNPVLIQSMCNTKTEDVAATVAQILKLEEAGCEIIRVAVPTMEAAEALKQIKKEIHIPLVADIHFDYRLAVAAIENGADKIRINPGNIGSRERVKAVVDAAKARRIPIRVGVNSGSLEKVLLFLPPPHLSIRIPRHQRFPDHIPHTVPLCTGDCRKCAG